MIPTADPDILIEEQRVGYVRYRRSDGARWEVFGVCDYRGDCAIGAVIDTPDGPVEIRDHAHLRQLAKHLNRGRHIQSELDVPIGPNPVNCCDVPGGPVTVRVL